MALPQKDLSLIHDLLIAQDQRLRLDLRDAFAQQAQDIKRDIRDEMDARFIAFEQRMDKAFQEIREVRRFVGMASRNGVAS